MRSLLFLNYFGPGAASTQWLAAQRGYRHVWLEEGEFLIVPRGVEHRPVAEEEANVLLFEPASTLNTGNVRDERTLAELEKI
jgi:mannose-6-phosphate isomerase-like protein (cupin superfamily)